MHIVEKGLEEFLPQVFNLINSNIGVGLLAMPFCFHECGIILTVVLLVLMSFSTYFSCALILNSTTFFRCDSLERAAFKSHGTLGKRLVELSVVCLLFGMLVGLNVAISDLGSEVFATICATEVTLTTRRFALLFITSLVTPLCFLRRVDFLSATSSAAVVLYIVFLLNYCHMPSLRFSPNPFQWHTCVYGGQKAWYIVYQLWQALSVVNQVNTIYGSLKHPSSASMKKILVCAICFIFACYSTAGLMGYIAFHRKPGEAVVGDMLVMYPEGHGTLYIRLGFLYTVAASLPLILFPLRTALHSLLFEEAVVQESVLSVDVPPSIPNSRFRWITGGVIFLSVVVSQITDKVEMILAYTGGLAGGASCYLLPAAIGARAIRAGANGQKRPLATVLILVLLYFFGMVILFGPILTFLGVDT